MDLPAIARNIELTEDGLWVAKTVSGVSYPDRGNDYCFAIEDSSFWFQHRNRCILEVMKSFPPSGVFFDIGGGNGYVARALQDAGIETVLIEPGPAGARNAFRRGVNHVIQGTLDNAGFQAGTIASAGLFDVLEHIEYDHALLTKLNELQMAGGRLYITVPSFQALWSNEDVTAGHFRRYTLRTISDVLGKSGYRIEWATYFFSFLVVPILLLRALPYRFGLGQKGESEESVRSDHELQNALTRRICKLVTGRELTKIAAGKQIRAGGSCLIVARKSC